MGSQGKTGFESGDLEAIFYRHKYHQTFMYIAMISSFPQPSNLGLRGTGPSDPPIGASSQKQLDETNSQTSP
jgi:hypothetical protein